MNLTSGVIALLLGLVLAAGWEAQIAVGSQLSALRRALAVPENTVAVFIVVHVIPS